MKYLIVAAEYGNGHLAVSQAIIDQLSSEDQYELIVTTSDNHSLKSKFSVYTYNNVISKHTKTGIIKPGFNALYNCGVKHKFLYNVAKSNGRKQLADKIKAYQPDVIVETYPHMIKDTYHALRVCVITDYNFANIYLAETANTIYCVASPMIKELMIAKFNVKPEQIFVTGIPVRPEFDQINLARSAKKILITLGARGQISKKDINLMIDSCLKNNLEAKIVCGKNETMYEYLKDRNDIKVYGFVDDMYNIYKDVDLVITKSGGISISECICAEKPMIINISQSLAAQESKNQEYINQAQIGISAKINEIDKAITKFATDEQFYQQVVDKIKQVKKDNYQQGIVDAIKNYIRSK